MNQYFLTPLADTLTLENLCDSGDVNLRLYFCASCLHFVFCCLCVYFADALFSSSMMDPKSKAREIQQERESATFTLKRFDSHKLSQLWFLS